MALEEFAHFFGESKEYVKTLSSTLEADKCLEMMSKIKYDEASPEKWRLKFPDEVLKLGKGNCHDTAYWVYNNLDKYAAKKVKKGILFFIEQNTETEECGTTHSLCYEVIPGGVCWIECSWGGMIGTFPYNSIEEICDAVFRNWTFKIGYNALYGVEITDPDGLKPGMSLMEYVGYVNKHCKEVFNKNKPTSKPITEAFLTFEDLTRTADIQNISEEKYKKLNSLKSAKSIAKRIHEQVEKDSKPPTGNQNCQLCTWCAEAQFRGIDALPRPIYSPRDPALNIVGETIVKDPVRKHFSSFDNLEEQIQEIASDANSPYARIYCHVNWEGSEGGHEFLILKIDNKEYTMDAQAGTVDPLSDTDSHFKDINYDNSYIARLDNREFNTVLFDSTNDPSQTLPWDEEKDIEYMRQNGMLSKEDEDALNSKEDSIVRESVRSSESETEAFYKSLKTLLAEESIERVNDKGDPVPEVCDKCGSKVGIYLHGEPVWLCSNKKCKKYFGTVPAPIQEAMIENGEPIKIENFPFDKVYVGSPYYFDDGILKENKVLFVTPYKGIASIFAEDKKLYKIPRGSYNIGYDEWSNELEDLKEPLDTVHVRIEGCPDYKPRTVSMTGYIYTIDVSHLKDKIYKYKWMSDDVEYLIMGLDKIPFIERMKWTHKCIVTGAPFREETVQEYFNAGMLDILPDGISARQATKEEVENWITSHGKKVKPNKTIKEEFNMSDFVRDPSVYKMILEAEAEEEAEEKGDALEDNDDENPDNDGDAIETSVEGEVEIGVDVGDVQNEYNDDDIDMINKLINSETSAISEYFNAAKTAKEPNLMRLYSDIGDEERFHLEQLLYAKATVTGEPYEPSDPKVKKEYQELLDMGLDEETAMTTAVDKVGLMPKEAMEDMSDDEAKDFEESFRMISSVSLQTQVMLEAVFDTSNISESIQESTLSFLDQMVIMEEVDNLNTRQGQKDLGTKNPIILLVKAFKAIYGFILNLARKAKLAFQKIRLRNKRKWAWIQKHGIGAIFAKGFSMYFYSEKKNMYDVGEPMRYLQLLHDMNASIINSCAITSITPEKYDLKNYMDKIISNAQGTSCPINVEPIAVRDIDAGIRILQGVSLGKTKVVLTNENQPKFEEQFFGYTKANYAATLKEGENSKNVRLSVNIYNQMSLLLDALTKLGSETQLIAEALANQEGTQNTAYDKNPGVWKKAVQAMSVIEKSVNKFNAAVSADISEMMKINQGLKEAMETADESGNRKAVDDYRDAVKKAQETNRQDSQKSAENADAGGSKFSNLR